MSVFRFFIFFLFLSEVGISQNSQPEFSLEIISGAEIGWWIYNKGSTEAGVKNNLGWDKARVSPFIPIEINGIVIFKKWSIGAGFNYSMLLENEMDNHRDSRQFFAQYEIAERFVTLSSFQVLTEYRLFQSPKFSLNPGIKAGYFLINTTHPQKDNFGPKLFWEFGLTHEIIFSRIRFLIRPNYTTMIIFPKNRLNENEIHHLYSFGVNVGMRLFLTRN